MDTTQLALLALLVGVLIGGSAVLVVLAAVRARERALAEHSATVPEGVADVLHAMDDAAVVVSASGLVVASSAAAAAFGLADGAVLAPDEVREAVRRAGDASTSVSETLRLRRGRPPADPRLVVVRATRISPRLTLVTFRDITERERVEQMRRDFVANTSHELKTPVGAISLLAEAIGSASDDPEQVRHFAARLGAEASRLGLLTSRIMNLSRLQAADELTELVDVSVDHVVAAAIDAHAVQAESARVSLTSGGRGGLHVRGDAQILADAVGNLIANAIAYSPPGSNVGVGVKEADGAVEIAVTDHGPGIPEWEQDRIFERFYRADQARSRRTGGTGLGLSIVKHAVQRHGGEVRVWSQPGHGSTFTIRLPLVASPDGAAGSPTGAKKAKKAKKVAKTDKPKKQKASEKPKDGASR